VLKAHLFNDMLSQMLHGTPVPSMTPQQADPGSPNPKPTANTFKIHNYKSVSNVKSIPQRAIDPAEA
jgi:hypothetical protein